MLDEVYKKSQSIMYIGDKENSTENIVIPEKVNFLRDSTISTAITMIVFYLIAAIAAGPEYTETYLVEKLYSFCSYISFKLCCWSYNCI